MATDTKAELNTAWSASGTRRSWLYHIMLVVAAFGLLTTLWLFQGKPLHQGGGGIRGFCEPVFLSLEGTSFAHLVLFITLFSIPEPSPIVVVFAWLAVYRPPVESWKWIVQNVGFEGVFYVALPCMICSIYIINGLLILALEQYIAPEAMNKIRLQKGASFNMEKTGKLARNLCVTLAGIFPVCAVVGRIMPVRFEEVLPGPLDTAFHIASYALANEIWFFHVHGMMHWNKWLYKNIHKVHHEFKNPNALSAIYCHPIENLVGNFGQFGIGAMLFGGHLYTFLLWTISAVLVTQTHHCGFRWPWIAPWGHHPNFHDEHHEKFHVNYGSFEGALSFDGLHGTLAAKNVDKKADKKAL